MRKKTLKLTLLILAVLLISGCGYYIGLENKKNWGEPVNRPAETNAGAVKLPASETPAEETFTARTEPEATGAAVKPLPKPEIEKQIEIKTTLNLPVAFAPQAPFADWSMPYQEACEEATIIMAAKYFKGDPLDKYIMDKEILGLVEWEKNYFGYWEDTTAAEVVEILDKYYGVRAYTATEVTAERIKRELNSGNLIIVPTAGRLLDNPYFSGEGPVYHMLVIRGYDRDEFITNDPGTKRGEGFKYKYDNLLNAVHDWNGTKEKIYEGQKIMVVVEK